MKEGDEMEIIKKNLQYLTNERSYVQVRLVRAQRLVRSIESHRDEIDGFEEIFGLLKAGVTDVQTILDGFDAELEKIKWGIETVENLEPSDARAKLIVYIERDTTLSKENFSTSRPLLDDTYDGLKSISEIYTEDE